MKWKALLKFVLETLGVAAVTKGVEKLSDDKK